MKEKRKILICKRIKKEKKNEKKEIARQKWKKRKTKFKIIHKRRK